MSEQLISREVLEKLYTSERKPIREIAKLLSRGEATVLRYMRIYGIERRAQNQWKGKHLSEHSKQLLREQRLDKKLSDETKKKIGDAHRGKPKKYFKKRLKNKQGYILLWCPDHPMSQSNGYIKEHRLVMSNHLQRFLGSSEIVHHLNEVKDDNRIENLELKVSKSEHMKIHWDEKRKKEHSEFIKELRKYKFWSTKKIV